MPYDQVDLYTYDVIRTWDSALDAANALDVKEDDIQKCCRALIDECGGFGWAKISLPSMASPIINPGRPVDTISIVKSSISPIAIQITDPKSTPDSACFMKPTQMDSSDPVGSKRKRDANPSVTKQQLSSHPPLTVTLAGVKINSIAIGTLAWGVSYPDASQRPSDAACREMIQIAMNLLPGPDSAPTIFDTSDSYCPDPQKNFGALESFLFNEIGTNPAALIATKGGMDRIGPDSNQWRCVDQHADFMQRFESTIRGSYVRLGREPIWLWQVHQCKSEHLVPIMRLAQRLQTEGIIRHVGVCNIKDVEELTWALSQMPAGFVVSVQNKFNVFASSAEQLRQREIIEYCELNGIIYFAYACFGGLDHLYGKVALSSFPILQGMAHLKGVSPHVLLLSYLRHSWPTTVVPLVGGRQPGHLRDLRCVYTVALSRAEVAQIRCIYK